MPAKLPKSVQEIADVIGRDLALHLVACLPRAYSVGHAGGQVILYVPKRISPDHKLVSLIGWNAAERLTRIFGGEILQPATCAHLYRDFRDENIRRLLLEGHAVELIAEWFGVSERHVRGVRMEIPQEERMRCGRQGVLDLTCDANPECDRMT